MGTFDKVTPGAPFSFPAAVYNELLDVIAWARGQRNSNGAGGSAGGEPALRWKNDSGSDAPRGAIFRITTTLETNNIITLKGNKPDGTLYPFYGISLGPLKNGAIGPCELFGRCRAHFHSTDGTPAFGESWGIEPSQWYLRKNRPGFFIFGNPQGTGATALVSIIQQPFSPFIGKLAAQLNQGSSASVNVWGGTAGSEAVISGLTVTGRDWLLKTSTNVGSGKKVVVQWINGKPHVTEAECA